MLAAASELPPSQAGPALVEGHLARSGVTVRRELFQSTGDTLLDDKYWRTDHFDVAQRLEDVRARAFIGADPRGAEAAGDGYADWAMVVAVLPVLIAGGYLAWWWLRRRRGAAGSGATGASVDVGLIPDPTDTTTSVAVLAFSAWLLLVLLPPFQIEQSLEGAKAGSRSATGAVGVMRSVIVSSLAASFEQQVQQTAESLEKKVDARAALYAALPHEATVGQAAILAAEHEVRPRYDDIAKATARTVRRDTTLDRRTVAAVTADPDDWQTELAAQQDATDRAGEAGMRDNAMTLALVLAGVATTLAALAAADRRSRAVPVMTALALAGAAGSALLGVTL